MKYKHMLEMDIYMHWTLARQYLKIGNKKYAMEHYKVAIDLAKYLDRVNLLDKLEKEYLDVKQGKRYEELESIIFDELN